MEWIKSNLWEINKSFSTKALGVLLSLTNIFTYLYWQYWFTPVFDSASKTAWPIFYPIADLMTLPVGFLKVLMALFLFFSTLAALGMFSARLLAPAWGSLVISFFIKIVIYTQDYNLISNTQNLLILLHLVFLFFPQKKWTVHSLVILFLVNLGLLKLNSNWLSGDILKWHLPSPESTRHFLATMSFLVEMIAPFGLLFRNWQVKVVSLLLLFADSIFIGAFYNQFDAVILSTLLGSFVFQQIEAMRRYDDVIYQTYIRPEPTFFWLPVFIIFYLTLQLGPRWLYPDAHQRYEGLLFSTVNLKSHQVCEVHGFESSKRHLKKLNLDLNTSDCDFYQLYHKLKQQCQTIGSSSKLEVYVKANDLYNNLTKQVQTKDFCDSNIKFSALGNNQWITTQKIK